MKYNASWTFHESSSEGYPKIIEKEFSLEKEQSLKFFIMAKTKKEHIEVRILDSENNLIFQEIDDKLYEKEKFNLGKGLYKIEIFIKNSKEAHIFMGIDGKIDKVKSEDI
jgi:flagellar hook assembly protein FlgD